MVAGCYRFTFLFLQYLTKVNKISIKIVLAYRDKLYTCTIRKLQNATITKTRLFKYKENFTAKTWKFSDKKNLIIFIFLLKT